LSWPQAAAEVQAYERQVSELRAAGRHDRQEGGAELTVARLYRRPRGGRREWREREHAVETKNIAAVILQPGRDQRERGQPCSAANHSAHFPRIRSKGFRQPRGAVKGAPVCGAAQRTSDGEHGCETMRGEGKGRLRVPTLPRDRPGAAGAPPTRAQGRAVIKAARRARVAPAATHCP
jgi:hypothetical protein